MRQQGQGLVPRGRGSGAVRDERAAGAVGAVHAQFSRTSQVKRLAYCSDEGSSPFYYSAGIFDVYRIAVVVSDQTNVLGLPEGAAKLLRDQSPDRRRILQAAFRP
jgi:hypothetical protein